MKKQKYGKEIVLVLMVIFSFLVLIPSASSVLTRGMIVQPGGAKVDLQYDTVGDSYGDRIAGLNPDAGLRTYADAAADVQGKFAGALYAAGVSSGNLQYVIITRDGSPQPLHATDAAATACGAGCWYADTPDGSGTYVNLQFADGEVGAGGGNPGASFFPGHPYIVISDDETVDNGNDKYVLVNPSNDGELIGTFSYSASIPANYNQRTGNVSFTPSGTSTAAASDHSNDAYLACGVCNDTYADNCSATGITDIGTQLSLNTSVVDPADNYIQYKFVVTNGIGTSFCIGPDLDINSIGLSPSGTFPPGKQITITATIDNDNNVDVNQSFNVTFYVDGLNPANQIGLSQNVTNVDGLGPGQSTTAQVVWDTTGFLAGSHTIYARLSDDWIGDCNDAGDNSSTTYSVKLVYLPNVWIDGVKHDNFSDAGRPYNVSIQINDSNGAMIPNVTVRVTEENGISVFAPLQTYTSNGVKKGLKPVSQAEVLTDVNGWADFTLIPTGNKMYALSEYGYTNISDHVGNYSLYLEIFNSSTGSELQLVQFGLEVGEYNLSLLNLTADVPNSSVQNSFVTFNQDTYVTTYMNFAYQILGMARRWINT